MALNLTSYTPDGLAWPLPTVADPSLPVQWWYFEGGASDSLASIQIVFMAGLMFPGAPVPLFVVVSGTREDGSKLPDQFVPATSGSVADGNGDWVGAGGWTAEGDSWTVTYAGPQGRATLKLTSSVPSGHTPVADESQVVPPEKLGVPLLFSGIGWSTTAPGATVQLDGTVGGEELKFEGTGFHDTNFVNGGWSRIIDVWYWTRGQAGPYTFVVYHFRPKGSSAFHTSAVLWDAREHAAALVDSWTGSAAWNAGQRVTVTPTGPWPEKPDGIRGARGLGLRVEFSAGDKQKWAFDVASAATVVDGARVPYGRWVAKTRGGNVGDNGRQETVTVTGTGSFDWFKFE